MKRIRTTRATAAAITLAMALVMGLLAAAPAPAFAADASPTAAEFARLQAEVTRLQQEIREQRQLLMNLMQADQQRYDVLLQLVRSLGGGAGAGANIPSMPAVPPLASGGAGAAATATPAEAGSAGQVGTISGKVTLPAGAGDAYVYIEGLRGGAGSRSRVVEIRQRDKQFSPQVAAVPVGSKLVFPNADTVFHNVFSSTPGHAFDTGSIKGGEVSRPVPLSKPGHLEIFCNIHRKMRADVLVVPNGYFTKVGTDGSFELSAVPAGSRRLVLWAPGIKTTTQLVELTAKGASVRLSAQPEPTKPHLNKHGQMYGSYED
jgi:plastocyanin